MPSLAEVQARVGHVDVYRELTNRPGMADVRWNLTYRLVDPDTIDAQAAAAAADASAEDRTEASRTRWAQNFIDAVVAHDLSAEPDGPPIPLTVEAVRAQIPTDLLVDALAAVASAKRPNRNGRPR